MQIMSSLVVESVNLHQCLGSALRDPPVTQPGCSISLPYVPLTWFEKDPFKQTLWGCFEAGLCEALRQTNYPHSTPESLGLNFFPRRQTIPFIPSFLLACLRAGILQLFLQLLPFTKS